MRRVRLGLLIAFSAIAADGWKPLADAHEWFILRRAISDPSAPAFYRGLTAAAFNNLPEAERYLRTPGLGPEHADAAHQALFETYIRNGLYPKAAAEWRESWRLTPPKEGQKEKVALLENLPTMIVASRKPASIAYSIWDDAMVMVPTTVNGRDGQFVLDTDSNFSTVCDSEAKRLGLTPVDGSMELTGINGRSEAGAQFAVAKTLKIGAVELHNVSFIVARDDQYPFADLPEGSRAILGLPVLLALRTIHWNREKRLDIGFPSPGHVGGAASLAFDGVDPIAEIEIAGHRVPVVFDTGDEESVAWERFALEFPSTLEGSKPGSEEFNGYSGKGAFESALVPSLQWKIGEFTTSYENAPVFTATIPATRRYYGRLGNDLLMKASEVTIDFESMQLIVK
jgi:hypothetical protein